VQGVELSAPGVPVLRELVHEQREAITVAALAACAHGEPCDVQSDGTRRAANPDEQALSAEVRQRVTIASTAWLQKSAHFCSRVDVVDAEWTR
jgi:hypothetical protein